MLVIGFAVLWAGYSVSSYGYVLVKGWNIPLWAWLSPIHPYQWPAKGADPPKIPQGRFWPQHNATPSAAQAGSQLDQQLQNDVTPGAA